MPRKTVQNKWKNFGYQNFENWQNTWAHCRQQRAQTSTTTKSHGNDSWLCLLQRFRACTETKIKQFDSQLYDFGRLNGKVKRTVKRVKRQLWASLLICWWNLGSQKSICVLLDCYQERMQHNSGLNSYRTTGWATTRHHTTDFSHSQTRCDSHWLQCMQNKDSAFAQCSTLNFEPFQIFSIRKVGNSF